MFEKKVAEAKDCFRKPLQETRLTWENVPKDSKNRVSWELFWEFLSSPKVLENIKKEGLKETFLAFELWEIPSFQQEFRALKPRFIAAFHKFDVDNNGYLDEKESKPMFEGLFQARADVEVVPMCI